MTIDVERREGVAVVTLNRPETKNAITEEMRRQLWDAFEGIALDNSVRAVILTGAGGNFCSGMDVGNLGQGGINGSLDRMHTLHRIARSIYHLKKPTIAAIPGCLRRRRLGLCPLLRLRAGVEADPFRADLSEYRTYPGWRLGLVAPGNSSGPCEPRKSPIRAAWSAPKKPWRSGWRLR